MNLLEKPSPEDYFHGILGISREEDGIRLLRMTPEQLAHYEARSGASGIRARCNAGVSLALRTDSPYLDVKFAILPGARKYFGLDVEIDGILSHAVRLDRVEGSYEARLFEFDGRAQRDIRVHFAPNLEVEVQEIGLAEDAAVAPLPGPERRLLCLGDSITQGMEAKSPISAYPVQLARLLDADLLNQGVGGYIYDPASLDSDLPFAPDLVTVAYGTNDWGRNTTDAQIRRTVRDYMARLRSIFPAARIAVLSPLWRAVGHEKKAGGDLPAFSQAILDAAAETPDVIPIDGLKLVPNQPWYLHDGTHPNDLGFLHYGLNLYRLLRDAIE